MLPLDYLEQPVYIYAGAHETMRIENFLQDLRHGARGLRRDPVLALAAAATLAIAIGANTTMFSLLDSILLRPLPYPGAERIYWLEEHIGKFSPSGLGPDYYSLRQENRAFEGVAAYDTLTLNWSGTGRPEQLDAAQVSASFFGVLGTRPLLGRHLAAGEEGAKAPPAAVISYAFWRSRLGSDRHVVGKTLRLDGLGHTIIGVMPQGFDYPNGTAIWRPLPMDEADQKPRSIRRPVRVVYMLGRLRPGVGEPALAAEMARLTRAIRAEYPPEYHIGGLQGMMDAMTIAAVPLQRRLTGDLRPALAVLSGAVALVLLIACVNLANLLLARSNGRRREIAVRLALGAGRGRVARQMLAESVLLALPGGCAGALLAWLAVAVLNTARPLLLERYPAISLDASALAFTFAITLATGLLFGMAPALSAPRVDVHGALKTGSVPAGGRSSTRWRRLLVAAELSLSLLLLVGAGLLGRSFLLLARVNPGFPAARLLTLTIKLVRSEYATAERQMQFWDDVIARVKQLPMVPGAAVATELPLTPGFRGQTAFQVAGRPPLPLGQRPSAVRATVSRGYFAAMGIPWKSGDPARFDGDRIVVNQALARRFLPGEEAVGRRLLFGPEGQFAATIAGVVGDTSGIALGAAPEPRIYYCECEGKDRNLTRLHLVVRTAGDPHDAIRAIEGQVYAVDRNQPVTDVKTMEERLDAALAPQRFQLLLIGSFAILALALAAAGVYGVMAYFVTRRTREIGIRMAMGARRRDVVGLVMRESLLLLLSASAAGLAGAWALTRYTRSMLYGVSALDPLSFLAAPLLLGAIVIAASLAPARRASAVDPIAALREE